MPRKARIDAPGALHHIIIRGIERKKIFHDNADKSDFLVRLGQILPESATSCYAWALLPNHTHLLLRTGTTPIATVMRRLLTGYAITYNRRHRRRGKLFQNRYKSILCQEDAYLLELVRYIHLNPLRAKMVPDLRSLGTYPFAGHGTIMGKGQHSWQDVSYVLGYFGNKIAVARRRYRDYVQKGIDLGRRPDLVGGGLIRGIGGWAETNRMRKSQNRHKADERIMGDSSFVSEVLEAADEQLDLKYQLRAKGYDLETASRRVAFLFDIEPEQIYSQGKYPKTVQARSLFCYWAVRQLGTSATALAKKLKLSQPAVSISVKRGEQIAKEHGFELLE